MPADPEAKNSKQKCRGARKADTLKCRDMPRKRRLKLGLGCFPRHKEKLKIQAMQMPTPKIAFIHANQQPAESRFNTFLSPSLYPSQYHHSRRSSYSRVHTLNSHAPHDAAHKVASLDREASFSILLPQPASLT